MKKVEDAGTATSDSHVHKQNGACNADIQLITMFKRHVNFMI